MPRLLLVLFWAVLSVTCAGRTPAASPPPPPPPPFIATAAEPAPLSGAAFDPACDVPFGSIGAKRDIDDKCGPEGEGSAASKLQNAAKNNFCAKGPVVDLTRSRLEQLQGAVNKLPPSFPWGTPTKIPKDRSPLRDIVTISGRSVGEGSLVRVISYFMHADYSNTSSGENVNCKLTGQANNDIHVYLAMTPDEDDRCQSLNAEITPHFRPEAWEKIKGLEIASNRPLRVTGQLFFDASHRPCTATHRASPARFTSWEIHPVYNLEVCKFKSASKCRVNQDGAWVPFDEWLGEDEHEEDTDNSGQP